MSSKKQSGFSLVEVLVVAGLLGGLALVIANINKDMTTTIRRAESTSEIVNIHSAVSQILLAGRGCVNTFQGRNVTVPFTVNAIRSQTTPIYDVFTVGETYGQDRARINYIQVEPDGPLSVITPTERGGNITVTVGYERISSVNMGTAYTIEREVNLQVVTNNAGELQECFSAEYNAIETARRLACESIQGVYNDVTELCELIPYQGFGSIDTRINAAVSENFLRQLLAVEVGNFVRVGPAALDTSKTLLVNTLTNFNGEATFNDDAILTGDSALLMPSDFRLKKNINSLENALQIIDQLELVSFNWKSTENKDIGVIAQNLQKYYPELVTNSHDGRHLLVKYPQLSVIALQGVKELSQQNKLLKEENEELKNKIDLIITSFCSRDPHESFCEKSDAKN